MKLLFYSLALAFWAGTAVAAETIQVFFSPHGDCTGAVVERLNKATHTVLVQAYQGK